MALTQVTPDVVHNVQSNITQVGTLSNLTVTGNVTGANYNYANGVSITTPINSALSTLTSNAAVQAGDIATIYANLGGVSGSLVTLTSNAAVQAGAIVTANTAMKGYVDGQISTTSSAITTANTSMKGYVDAVTTAWTANAGAQAGSIATLTANAATQSGAIASKANSTDTLYVGTTAIALNRTSASQSLTGVNIDGSSSYASSAGSATTAGSATLAASLSSQSGSAPSYAVRAFVNFNGTGVVAIRESQNVSSITDSGTGRYVINLSTAMPTSTYSCVGSCGSPSGRGQAAFMVNENSGTATASTTTTQPIYTYHDAGGAADSQYVTAIIIG